MDWRWTDSLGVALSGHDLPGRTTDLARAAERAGLGSLWIIEDYFDPGAYALAGAAAALTAVMQLAARGGLDAEQTIVVVLTSGGLKDPGASRTWLPPVPTADGDVDRLLTVLRESYGLALDR